MRLERNAGSGQRASDKRSPVGSFTVGAGGRSGSIDAYTPHYIRRSTCQCRPRRWWVTGRSGSSCNRGKADCRCVGRCGTGSGDVRSCPLMPLPPSTRIYLACGATDMRTVRPCAGRPTLRRSPMSSSTRSIIIALLSPGGDHAGQGLDVISRSPPPAGRSRPNICSTPSSAAPVDFERQQIMKAEVVDKARSSRALPSSRGFHGINGWS